MPKEKKVKVANKTMRPRMSLDPPVQLQETMRPRMSLDPPVQLQETMRPRMSLEPQVQFKNIQHKPRASQTYYIKHSLAIVGERRKQGGCYQTNQGTHVTRTQSHTLTHCLYPALGDARTVLADGRESVAVARAH
jgi:hypothetical protein